MVTVKTGAQYAQDVRSEFYFSSPPQYGGQAQQGDTVSVLIEVSKLSMVVSIATGLGLILAVAAR